MKKEQKIIRFTPNFQAFLVDQKWRLNSESRFADHSFLSLYPADTNQILNWCQSGNKKNFISHFCYFPDFSGYYWLYYITQK